MKKRIVIYSLLAVSAAFLLNACSKDEEDKVAPTVTLKGSDIMYVQKGQTFTDPGSTGMDDVDGNISVTTDGKVNKDVLGTYSITYFTVDKAGNKSTVKTRTVYVVDFNGQYDVVDKVTSTDTSINGKTWNYVAGISVSSTTNNKYTIGNFGYLGASVFADATWSGNTVTFNGPVTGASQNGTVTGTGTISESNGSKMSLSYKIVWAGGSVDNDIATFTKK